MRGIFAKYKTKVGDGVYMVALDNIDPEYLEKYEAFNLKIA